MTGIDEIDFDEIDKLRKSDLGAAFKRVFYYISNAAKQQHDDIDFIKLGRATKLVVELMRDVSSIPKYKDNAKAIAYKLQGEIWGLFNFNKLRDELMENIWLDARKSWFDLDVYVDTKKCVRAIFHTMELISPEGCMNLLSNYREEIIGKSSIPGFGLRIANELMMLLDSSYKISVFDKNIQIKDKKSVSPSRETIKEIKAILGAIRMHIPKMNLNHILVCLGRFLLFIKPYLSGANLKIIQEAGDEGDIISHLSTIYQIVANQVASMASTESAGFAIDAVLYPLAALIAGIAKNMSRSQIFITGSDKIAAHSVHVVHRLLVLLTERVEIDRIKRIVMAETVVTLLVSALSFTIAVNKTDADFQSKDQWALVESAIREFSSLLTTFELVDPMKTSIVSIIKSCGVNSLDPEDSFGNHLIEKFIGQVLLTPLVSNGGKDNNTIFQIFSCGRNQRRKKFIFEIYIKVLTEEGIPRDLASARHVVDTIHSYSKVLETKDNQSEDDLEQVELVVLQLKESFPDLASKLIGFDSVSSNEVTKIWTALCTWQRDMKKAWNPQTFGVKAPPAALDVNYLASISIQASLVGKSENHMKNYIMTCWIVGQLLLVVGKRQDGTRILKDLVKLILHENLRGDFLTICSDLLFELGYSTWVNKMSSVLCDQRPLDEDILGLFDQATNLPLSKESFRRAELGRMFVLVTRPVIAKQAVSEAKPYFTAILGVRLKTTSTWHDYYDLGIAHLSKAVSVGRRNMAANLRYSIQLNVTVLSTSCDRSFFSTLFSSPAKKVGTPEAPQIGREALCTIRALDKVIWQSVELTDDFIMRGLTTEARQFSNELIALSEIWGLQLPFIIAKSNQIRALEFEGQTRLWRSEVKILEDVFSDVDKNSFMKEINPAACAAAVTLEPPRRTSSTTATESEKHKDLPLPNIKFADESDTSDTMSPMSKSMLPKMKPQTFTMTLPSLPSLSLVDVDIARMIVIAFNTMLRVYPDSVRAVSAGVQVFREMSCAGHKMSRWILETASIVIERAVEIDRSSEGAQHIIDAMDQLCSSTGCEKFARFMVARAVYRRKFSPIKCEMSDVMVEPFKKMALNHYDVKTPIRKIKKEEPVSVKLGKLKKVQIFNDDMKPPSINICTPKSVKKNKNKGRLPKTGSDDPPEAPSVRQRRATRAETRRVKLEKVEEDRGDDPVFDVPVSPIKSEFVEQNRERPDIRSRPGSPIAVHLNAMFAGLAPIIDGSGDGKSDEDQLIEAYEIAMNVGDMETARAVLNIRIGDLIKREQDATSCSVIISDSRKMSQLHQDVVGLGAMFETVFCCQMRLENTMSPSQFPQAFSNAKQLAEGVDPNQKMKIKLPEPVVIVSLIPDYTHALRCSYEKCFLLVTRLEPTGKVISIAQEGAPMFKEAAKMRDFVDALSKELGENTGNASEWWANRKRRNTTVVDLFTKVMPDILGAALPLFNFSKSLTWTSQIPKPKISLHADYLSYAVRAWSFLNSHGHANVAGILGIRKTHLDMFAKRHICSEMTFQRASSTNLVLGRLIQTLPFERMRICYGLRITRMPSVRHAAHLLQTPPMERAVDISNLLYVVDNQENLENSAAIVGNFFSAPPVWFGWRSQQPKSNILIDELNKRSLYVFAGHGSGSDAVGGWGRVIRKGLSSTAHLIGCASGRLRDTGRCEPRGAPWKIIDSGSKSVLALLWSVTDRDIDRYSLRMYSDWFTSLTASSKEKGPSLSQHMMDASRACKFGPINAGAVVNYGLIPTAYNIPENWDRGLPQKINYS